MRSCLSPDVTSHDALSRHSCRRRWLCLGRLTVAILLLTSPTLPAQQGAVDKRLVLSVLPEFGVVRGQAPVPASVSLRWNSSELIEGRLQLEWFVDTTRLGRYVSSELALSDSTVRLNVELPPIVLPYDDATTSVQGKFLTDRTVYDLGEHDVAVQPDWRRILVAAVCTKPRSPEARITPLEAGTNKDRLSGDFRLQPFFENHFTKRELLVQNAEVDPDDVPTDPLKMTAFDLFIVPAESLSKLKPRQLECLLSWVRAGGSLCVFVDSAVPETHLGWLNRLAGRDVSDVAYVRGADGHLLAVDEASKGLHRHYVDLGRTIVALGKPDLATDDWEQAVLFLWKVRADRCDDAARDRLWEIEVVPFSDGFDTYATMEPLQIWQQPELETLLLPHSVSGLPLGTVGLMLVSFLLVIAPGDYYLLGWLKRRRWTWILFPIVSLLVTGFTMWLARQHLGHTSYEHAITIVDLGDDGRPVRTSRIEMLYAASTRTVTAELQDQLMVPLDPSRVRRNGQPFAYGPSEPKEYEPPWTYSGRVPQNYSVARDVQQWAPRFARVTAFGGASPSDEAPADDTPTVVLRVTPKGPVVVQPDARISESVIAMAVAVTSRGPSTYFSIVSQLSPTSGGNLEDLCLLDPSDTSLEAVVEIRRPAEGQYVVTRRLERKQD